MNKYIINVYTAHHTDGINKELVGAAYAAVIEQDGAKKTISLYGEEDTYMTIWMKGTAEAVKYIQKMVGRIEGEAAVEVNIFVWHSNIQKICTKMSSIYRDLKGFSEDVGRILDRKLQRANRTKYDHHDDQKTIIETLLEINRSMVVSVKFKPLPTHHPDMGTAYQAAAIALEDGSTE